MPIWVCNKSSIIPSVIILPNTRFPIILPTCLQPSFVEFIDLTSIPCGETDMNRASMARFIATRHKPELRLVMAKGVDLIFGHFKVTAITQRGEELSVKLFGCSDILDINPNVIEDVGHFDSGGTLDVCVGEGGKSIVA